MNPAPKTLQEAIIHFSNTENCHEFMVKLRLARMAGWSVLAVDHVT